MAISVVIPAFNEERYLPQTLEHLGRAVEALGIGQVETIVVDNDSTDRTAEVARAAGAKVVPVPEHNIAKVRNAGAAAAMGEWLVFVDADTLVPPEFLVKIVAALEDPACAGGAVDLDYQPVRFSIRLYLRCWRVIGLMFGMAQGAAQFCRRDDFLALGGYDETIYMGEDVDFYWRLGRRARQRGGYVRMLKEIRVVPSCRRYDQWPLYRTLIQTNPFYAMFFQRRRSAWRGWYSDVPR